MRLRIALLFSLLGLLTPLAALPQGQTPPAKTLKAFDPGLMDTSVTMRELLSVLLRRLAETEFDPRG